MHLAVMLRPLGADKDVLTVVGECSSDDCSSSRRSGTNRMKRAMLFTNATTNNTTYAAHTSRSSHKQKMSRYNKPQKRLNSQHLLTADLSVVASHVQQVCVG